ncbi:MAG: ABC transporter permease [Candidatus Zixiibacteriota bacterium]|nr:MAG: ABC transporter permease [candidate division Zixibacteria bacterium]
MLGLAIGITCLGLAIRYTQHEFSFDRFHKDADRVYRVCSKSSGAATPGELAPTILERSPAVESATRLQYGSFDQNRVLFHYRDKSLYSRGYYADEHFFEIFPFPFVRGDPGKALAEPNSIVVTEDFSRRYFGDENPIGETINFENKHDLTVVGIIENVPSNSHLQFDFLVSFSTYATTTSGQSYSRCWACCCFLTYVKLNENAAVRGVEDQLDALVMEKTNIAYTWFLQPLEDIRLFSALSHEPGTLAVSDIYYVYLALSIAVLILILGCLNYISITTARAASRASEIGVRKVVGARRKDLIAQHMVESLLVTLFALLLSLILIELLIPMINSFARLGIGSEYLGNFAFMSFMILLCVLVSLIAGGYPALVLSSIRPLRVISKLWHAGREGVRLRRLFVIIQFGMAICLLTISLIIDSQLNYVGSEDIGYDRENVVVLKLKGDDFENNRQNIKNEILGHSRVISATYSSHLPCAIKSSTEARLADNNGDTTYLIIHCCDVDETFADVYDLEFVSGRNFSQDFNDTWESSVILNEAAVKVIDWENRENKRYTMWGNIDAEVVGVVKDFNFLSLHNNIAPLVLLRGEGSYLSVKIQPDDMLGTIGYMDKVVSKFIPDYPFEYKMYEDHYQAAYTTENNLSLAFNVFAGIAIFVACLGLVGLSAYSTAQKSKEIAIRKILGASAADNMLLLTREFLLLVVIANVLAYPVAYYIMNRWLENFVYRIDIGISSFISAGLAALIVALLTVGYQAVKAAFANPIDGIRYE